MHQPGHADFFDRDYLEQPLLCIASAKLSVMSHINWSQHGCSLLWWICAVKLLPWQREIHFKLCPVFSVVRTMRQAKQQIAQKILTGRFFLSMPPAPTLAEAFCSPLEAMTTHLEWSPTCRALRPAVLVCSSQASVCKDLRSWWNCCCRVYRNTSLQPSLPCASKEDQRHVDLRVRQVSQASSVLTYHVTFTHEQVP